MDEDYSKQRQWSWRNFTICCLLSCGQLAFGYASSIIGTTLGQTAFLFYMGLVDPTTGEETPHANALIGATNGVFQAGAFFGVLLGSWVMDRFGRKAGVIFSSTLTIIGGACLCASQNIGMFIAFRFVSGAGSWAFLALTPVYVSELSPPRLRGLFVGLGGIGITTGYAIASYMGLAFNLSLESHPAAQWRGPLGLQCVFPFLMLVILPWMPESPRWLLMQGKVDRARKIIMDIHRIPGDPNLDYARSEFYQMQKQAEHDKELEPSWLEMFTKPTYRKRTLLACLFAFLGQSTAVLVINNYGPTLYEALGYGVKDRLILQAGWVTVGIPSNALGAFIVDRVGRIPLMTFSLAASCVCLILEVAMIATYASPIPANPNYGGLKMGVAAFYLFLFVYSVGIDVCGNIYFSELFPNHIRSKGVSLAIATLALTDLVYLQAASTAFANIGWKFFLLFIILSGLGAILWFSIAPETKGVPLEEMAVLFGESSDVAIYARDVHVDHNTHQLVIDKHGDSQDVVPDATEGEKSSVEHQSMAQV